MGEVTDFPATTFRIVPPARRLTPTERLKAAYQVVDDSEEALRLGNNPMSGVRLLALVAINTLMAHDGKAATLDWLYRAGRTATPSNAPTRNDDDGAAA